MMNGTASKETVLFLFVPPGPALGDRLVIILDRLLVFLTSGGLGRAGEGLLFVGAVRHGQPDPVLISSSFFTKTSGLLLMVRPLCVIGLLFYDVVSPLQ